MEFLNSRKFIVIMLIVLVWAGASGCTPTDYIDKESPHQTDSEYQAEITAEMEEMDKEQAQKDQSGPTDFVGIAEVLGCMFAPNDCVLEKRKQEKEMDR